MSMMNGQSGVCQGTFAMKALENGLAATLARTAQQIQHADCFDQEQRAEIYAILQALRTDTEAHRIVAEFLTERLGGGAGNA